MQKISVWEMWACAAHFMSRYGADASLRAAEISDELLAAGDVVGARTFATIARRIEELTRHEEATIH